MTKQETALKKYLEWLEEEPRLVLLNNDESEYVPISVVQEDLMIGYNGNTKMELLRENFHTLGMSAVGRLHYKHPVTGEWLFQDGSAAIPFRDTLRLDFPSLSAHVMLSCAKKIGKRFGRDLNREIQDAPFISDEKTAPLNGKKKPPAVEMIPDAKMQESYNIACENFNQPAMRTIQSVYPSIKYTGTKNLANAES